MQSLVACGPSVARGAVRWVFCKAALDHMIHARGQRRKSRAFVAHDCSRQNVNAGESSRHSPNLGFVAKFCEEWIQTR